MSRDTNGGGHLGPATVRSPTPSQIPATPPVPMPFALDLTDLTESGRRAVAFIVEQLRAKATGEIVIILDCNLGGVRSVKRSQTLSNDDLSGHLTGRGERA